MWIRRFWKLLPLFARFRPTALRSGARDPIGLTKAVLTAAEGMDRKQLDCLMLSEMKWRQVVSSEPFAKGHEYAACKKASDQALHVLLKRLGGHKWKIQKMTLLVVGSTPRRRFPKEFFGSGPNVTLQAEDGQQLTLQPIPLILGHKGVYKVGTYSTSPNFF